MSKYFSLAWWRVSISHKNCASEVWHCTDGWICSGCGRSWDVNGRLDD